ncbi:MAG: hypothetical protein KTR28_09465 [Micavibrio sp.]|nr:hypothetical protein [Micavibrio sp.]
MEKKSIIQFIEDGNSLKEEGGDISVRVYGDDAEGFQGWSDKIDKFFIECDAYLRGELDSNDYSEESYDSQKSILDGYCTELTGQRDDLSERIKSKGLEPGAASGGNKIVVAAFATAAAAALGLAAYFYSNDAEGRLGDASPEPKYPHKEVAHTPYTPQSPGYHLG